MPSRPLRGLDTGLMIVSLESFMTALGCVSFSLADIGLDSTKVLKSVHIEKDICFS